MVKFDLYELLLSNINNIIAMHASTKKELKEPHLRLSLLCQHDIDNNGYKLMII